MPPRRSTGAPRSTSQVRRLQAATADPKASITGDDRAVEHNGVLSVPIAKKLFHVQDSIGFMPLMEWAVVTEDIDASNPAQLASLFRLLKDIVAPEQWVEFRTYTTEQKCTPTDFAAFVNATVEAMAARPTQEPATS